MAKELFNENMSDVSDTLTTLDATVSSVTEKFEQSNQINKRSIVNASTRAQEYSGALRIANETLRQIVNKQKTAVEMLHNLSGEEDSGSKILDFLGERIRERIRRAREAREEAREKERLKRKAAEEEAKKAEEEAKKAEEERRANEAKNAEEEKKASESRQKRIKEENDKRVAEEEAKVKRQGRAADNKEAREQAQQDRTKAQEEISRKNEAINRKEAREQAQAERVAKSQAKAEPQAEKVDRGAKGVDVYDDTGRFKYNSKTDRWGDSKTGRFISDKTAADLGLESRQSIKQRLMKESAPAERVAAPPKVAEVIPPTTTPAESAAKPGVFNRYTPKAVGVAGKVLTLYVAYELIKDSLIALFDIIAIQKSNDPDTRRKTLTIISELSKEYGLAAVGFAMAFVVDAALGAIIGAVFGAGIGALAGLIGGLAAAITTMEVINQFDDEGQLTDYILMNIEKALVAAGLGGKEDENTIKEVQDKLQSAKKKVKEFNYNPNNDPLIGPGGEDYRQFRDGGISEGPEEGYPVTLHGTELIIPISQDGKISLKNLDFNARSIVFNAKSYIFSMGEFGADTGEVDTTIGGGGLSRPSMGLPGLSQGLSRQSSLGGGMSSLGSLYTQPQSSAYAPQPLDLNAKSTPFSGSQGEFYSRIYNAVFQAAKAKGLPNPEIIAQLGASQASVETGYGAHMVGNNVFGIKGKGPAGTIQANTTEFVGGAAVGMSQGFAAYNSIEESAAGYVDFITNNPRYSSVLQSKNVGEAAMAIAAAGYATDPYYAQKIFNIANKSTTLVTSNQNVGTVMNSMVSTHDAFKLMKEDTSEKPAPAAVSSLVGEKHEVPSIITHDETPLPVRLRGVTEIPI